jgi:hypothetical protein
MRDPVSSAVFKSWMPSTPERVWQVLTCPHATARILRGLSASSTWQPAAPLTLRGAGGITLTGTVLRAVPHTGFAFSIDDASGTSTIVSVLLRPLDAGCVVTLTVDEFPGDCTGGTELEDTWLPVLEGLRGELCGQR